MEYGDNADQKSVTVTKFGSVLFINAQDLSDSLLILFFFRELRVNVLIRINKVGVYL